MSGTGNRLALDAGQNASIADFFQQYPDMARFRTDGFNARLCEVMIKPTSQS